MAKYKKNNRGSYVLQGKDGGTFTVTKKEYDELIKYTKRANQRRVDTAHRLYDALIESEMMVGKSYNSYMGVLEHTNIITEKYTSSLGQFTSKEDVKEHLKELKTVTQRGYGNEKIDNIRYKMLDQIKNNYGSQGDNLYNRIKNMDKAELVAIYNLGDNDLIQTLFGSPEGDSEMIEGLVNKAMTRLDKLTKGAIDHYKFNEKEFKKGFKNWKTKTTKAKNKRAKEYAKTKEKVNIKNKVIREKLKKQY